MQWWRRLTVDVRTNVLHVDALPLCVMRMDRNKENKVSNDLYPVLQYLPCLLVRGIDGRWDADKGGEQHWDLKVLCMVAQPQRITNPNLSTLTPPTPDTTALMTHASTPSDWVSLFLFLYIIFFFYHDRPRLVPPSSSACNASVSARNRVYPHQVSFFLFSFFFLYPHPRPHTITSTIRTPKFFFALICAHSPRTRLVSCFFFLLISLPFITFCVCTQSHPPPPTSTHYPCPTPPASPTVRICTPIVRTPCTRTQLRPLAMHPHAYTRVRIPCHASVLR